MIKNTQRALISVSDKKGIVDFARVLHQRGVEILSTGGTARELASNGVPVIEVADVTGFPEIMGGRVKTLHPKIHGGILARRDLDQQVMQEHGIIAIDLVVVNLYPFEQTIANEDCTLDEAIENIDIGGPAMIRAAAKNYGDVLVVTSPADYDPICRELSAHGGTTQETRMALAQKAYSHTAAYDSAIAAYLAVHNDSAVRSTDSSFEQNITLKFEKQQDLRYGENPHQAAAFYKEPHAIPQSISNSVQLQGKELSFNNIADADAALECVKQFDDTACVIVKHANPCGVCVADSIEQAYKNAYMTDPVSAFGGIIAFNTPLNAATAKLIVERQFAEVIVAPVIDKQALAVLSEKPNIRVLECGKAAPIANISKDYRRVSGGLLVQDADVKVVSAADLDIVTKVKPTEDQLRDLLFAWKVVKFVKSNAIVFCRQGATIGVGAGQMSRVYSAKIAAIKASDASLEIKNTVMASDAFFPFRDTVDQAAELGVSAIIQPGGSMRDDEAVESANEHGIAMAFTGIRHFRH